MPRSENQETTMIEQMATDLAQIREALERLEKMGFSEELMEIYIYKKTNVNMKEVRAVLSTQKDFLKQAFQPVNPANQEKS